MLDIGYLAAFLGGVLALLSPCSALLLPSFFAYAFGGITQMFARTGVFFLGLVLVLVPLGAGLGGLSALIADHRIGLIVLAGSVIIVLGFVQILGGGWSLGPAARLQAKMAARSSWVSTFGLGAAYGLAGFCTGPILGAVLTVAAAGGDPVRGAFLLVVYALGMAAPLFGMAALWQRLNLRNRNWLRGRSFRVGRLVLHTNSTVSGLLFIAVGTMLAGFSGGADLFALDPGTALRAEGETAALAGHVPDTGLLLALAVIVVLVVVYRLRRQGAMPQPVQGAIEPAPGTRIAKANENSV